MESPREVPRATFALLRGERPLPAPFSHLWSVGSLEGLPAPVAALVGTRAPSGSGRALARQIGAQLAAAGCTVLSGLALGIDTAAHEGALEASGRTIGVLGGGHDRFFPRRNAALAQRILAYGGAILSPYAPGTPPRPHQFLERNAIVAALADAVVVVEAPARSGALNTAGWAAGHVPVLAVPADVERPQAAGCHALIRDGAVLCRGACDVLEALGIAPIPAAPQAAPLPYCEGSPEWRILHALRNGERSREELIEHLGADAAGALAALAVLELDAAVERREGARYALAPR